MVARAVLSEDFSRFEVGFFSAAVGPLTEYHYLPEAAPRQGWSVAAFGLHGADRAWRVEDHNGRRAMCQTFENKELHTHPMVASGNPGGGTGK